MEQSHYLRTQIQSGEEAGTPTSVDRAIKNADFDFFKIQVELQKKALHVKSFYFLEQIT